MQASMTESLGGPPEAAANTDPLTLMGQSLKALLRPEGRCRPHWQTSKDAKATLDDRQTRKSLHTMQTLMRNKELESSPAAKRQT
jgi:hypothetical protein